MPAAPEWRDGNRSGERRASLPVFVDGVESGVQLNLTIRINDSDYLMMLLLAGSSVFCRLCMTTGHWDRLTKTQVDGPHFHSWEANRTERNNIPKELSRLENIPVAVLGRDMGFAWFLTRNRIECTDWAAPRWPASQGLF